MTLQISVYDQAEAIARQVHSNRVIEAGQSEAFAKLGYPTRIDDDSALWRFADVMQERRFEGDYRVTLGGLTRGEFELFKEIGRKTFELVRETTGRRLFPKSALLRSFLSLRHLRYVLPAGSLIVEIGPGCGYLGALIVGAGYRYAATDVAQAFYIFQNRLWSRLFPGAVRELAEGGGIDALSDPKATLVHVPWWTFFGCEPAGLSRSVDAVVANHALCEMHHHSMLFTIAFGREVLRAPPGRGIFFVEGRGQDLSSKAALLPREFLRRGYTRVFYDHDISPDSSHMDIFALRAKEEWARAEQVAASLAALRGGSVGSRAQAMLSLARERGGVAAFRGRLREKFLGPSSAGLNDFESNEIAREIVAGRAQDRAAARVPYDEVTDFIRATAGDEALANPDERFLDLCYRL